MALLAAIALALLLTVVTATLLPSAAQAAADQPPTGDGATSPGAIPSARESARAGGIQQAPSVPRRGESSNPYDMEALRRFDAGSHR